MHPLATLLWALVSSLSAATITFQVQRSSNPTADEQDAYARIEAAMSAAAARYNRLAPRANKAITVQYVPSVPTADGNFNGNIRFGSNRAYMTERTALHETAHTLGVGQTRAFDDRCAAGSAAGWPSATALLRSWDGPDAVINCGGGHFWPYGLNYESEMSETNADRHCLLVNAMLADGLAG
ncbi:pectin lyase-like protein [Thermothelomyces thermophilus ATCC 42464]|uniref:Pectin lyase-like protein n=1 Tax=Thermothelomyces thermophilus (strain ATCC 42464 / BCRC 31852 / DSM 1799) TaxID=573729 RepID=G2Q8R8_THET4|nr:pectin lyase-like protein [Thermothelomyces thermophilus ATCC 42464]AEO57117.1 pectin lyase-like protein [Thermothelomyces thermophilus ATCC 42464]